MSVNLTHDQPRIRIATSHRGRRAVAGLALAVAAALAGCSTVRSATAELPTLPQMPPLLGSSNTPVRNALAYHETIRGMNGTELARERSTLSGAGNAPLTQMKQAMLLSHPQGNNNLQRAQSLLEAISGSDKADAVALHPLARLLAEHVQERARLESTAERLTQQLERTGQQLKDAQKQSDQLQEKLDALTEIERTLPARPSAPTPPLPSARERRNDK
ncbi:BREX-1 system adenine-specific DNA-methyltransferase PglX [Aromatoleum toluclasticum]|uniref:BREX-1 system adenine-specific DNA-methyltransferase PglX n=1 Tax=Aromatoleum toluclasticum TaxID=92003 RepID=UPI001D18A03F|nr:BREX-1 system adenine-specific DNA-methyltransferase PglX [Aromatoleum toluclasticum]MCC4118308.1 BREX-1 system adenine-specific DNA-methyltransferase PglX [Aromatoleum toluclasticum]